MPQPEKRPLGRPRGFEEKAALEGAMLQFWRDGYGGTSIEDLAAASGAARASLYRTFGDKRAIFGKSLDLYARQFEARVEEMLEAAPSAREALRMILSVSAERLTAGASPPGCLRCNATLELTGMDAEMDAILNDANDRYVAGMQRVIDRAAASGELGPSEAVGLATFYTGVTNGMVVLARSGADRETLMGVIDAAMRGWPRAETVGTSDMAG